MRDRKGWRTEGRREAKGEEGGQRGGERGEDEKVKFINTQACLVMEEEETKEQCVKVSREQ